MPESLPYASVTSSDAAPVRTTEFRLRRGQNWFFIGLTYASYYFNRYNLAIAKTDFCQAFGFSNSQYSYIQTARSWSYAFGLIFNGLLADRFGGRLTMAIGGYGTAVMNLLFGLAAYKGLMGPLFGVLGWFVLLRGIDGYIQAFGAPGMVKTNTAWFARRERGLFAGIFGLMINLGRFINNTISPLLLGGFTIWSHQFPGGGWQWVFFVPAVFVTVITSLMLLLTKDTPEDAGFVGVVQHEDGAGENGQAVSLSMVARTILVNPFVWLTAGAYFCTGVVRYGVDDWFPAYFREVQKVSLTSASFQIAAWGLPIVATLGSILSGYVSDRFFAGRRAPVAAALYFIETVIILIGAQAASRWSMTAALLCIAFTCNSTHSILGTAAPMDIGGRKMAGFATGFIDAFQYLGAGVAGLVIGWLIDHYGWGSWLYSMAGFGVLGGILMLFMQSGERRQGGVASQSPPQVKA